MLDALDDRSGESRRSLARRERRPFAKHRAQKITAKLNRLRSNVTLQHAILDRHENLPHDEAQEEQRYPTDHGWKRLAAPDERDGERKPRRLTDHGEGSQKDKSRDANQHASRARHAEHRAIDHERLLTRGARLRRR